jgi:hypothetical protein
LLLQEGFLPEMAAPVAFLRASALFFIALAGNFGHCDGYGVLESAARK